MRKHFTDIWRVSLLLGWLILAALLLYPLRTIIAASFKSNADGHFTLQHYVDVFTKHIYYHDLINTFIGGFGGMIGSLVLGVALAALVTRFKVRGPTVISSLAVIALVTPPFIGAYAWIILLGYDGVIRQALLSIGIPCPTIYGAGGVIFVFSLKFFPYVFLIVSAALRNVNSSLEEAAELLGMPPGQRFWKVTLRLIAPAVSASGLLTFILSVADFGTPRFIGHDFQTLSTQAYILFSSETGENPGMASTISLVLLAISLVLVLGQRWFVRHDLSQGSKSRPRPPREMSLGTSILVHGVCYLIAVVGVLPMITVFVESFRKKNGPVFMPGFSLDSYRQVLGEVPVAIENSLLYAGVAVVGIVIVGTVLGYIIVRKRNFFSTALDAALTIPYIVPGIVMGIAYAASFNTGAIAITGTATIIILQLFIRRLPYAMRAMIAALQQVSPSIEDAAISLGYSPLKVLLRVTVPLIGPGILAGAIMSFITAINELSATLVLYVGNTVTMPVQIFELVDQGEYGTASALSSILLLVTTILVYIAFRVGGGRQMM
ncbi:ABC transporter permease [Candidimonas nitroreducens]|uniref:ABC transporter permease n=1 Tax=Candidimonas nitroreducens TaxID=683354 RepID=A0A225MRW5_9BURK|nr:iron ABC transporter permease [Candidimonas nitroreducens]OWT64077.1 ABC transporter permease [Candidimonas nitroreducens]